MYTTILTTSLLAAVALAAPGPAIICDLQAFTGAGCTGTAGNKVQTSGAEVCVETAGTKSFRVSGGFCPNGIQITEYSKAKCANSGIIEPVFNATEVSHPSSCFSLGWRGRMKRRERILTTMLRRAATHGLITTLPALSSSRTLALALSRRHALEREDSKDS